MGGRIPGPHRLAYPEHIPEKEHHRHLYENEEDFYAKLRDAALNARTIRQNAAFRHFVDRYDWSTLAAEYDEKFGQMASEAGNK